MAIDNFWWFRLIRILYAVFDFSVSLKDIDMKPFSLTLLLNFGHFE